MKRKMHLKQMIAALLCAAMLITQSTAAFADEILVEEASEYSGVEGEDSDFTEGKLPYGLSGMPEEYTPDTEDMENKAFTREHEVAETVAGLTPGEDYLERQIIYSADSREYAEQVAEAYNAALLSFSYGVAVAELPEDGATVAQAVKTGADPGSKLPAVAPNYITRLEEPPVSDTAEIEDNVSDEAEYASASPRSWLDATEEFNDPYLIPGEKFDSHDAFDETSVSGNNGYQWMHDMIGTYEAWGTTKGSKEITVAVIDSGVDTQHEDLQSVSGGRTTEEVRLSEYEIIETEDGKSKKVPITDSSGHGTHVAGIIGATANNGKGGAGVAPGVNILGLPIFFFDPEEGGHCTDAAEARAINYVAGKDADGADKSGVKAQIINISIGGVYANPTVQEAMDYAYSKKVTVVVSMGNDCVNAYKYPAGYDHVIAVAAVDRDGEKAGFSCYGDWCDIAAPGVDIFSTWNGHEERKGSGGNYEVTYKDHHDWYALMDGTSMATPVVAGACALYMSYMKETTGKDVTPDDMEAVLKKSATKISDKTIGAGIVNVAAMMPDSAKEGDAKLSTPDVTYKAEGWTEFRELADAAELSASAVLRIDAPEAAIAHKVSYSVNGKTPSFEEADVIVPGREIRVSELLEEGVVPGRAFTLKAAYSSPQGTVSRVKTIRNLKITAASETEGFEIDGAEYIAQGRSRSFTVKAKNRAFAVNSVAWSAAPVSANEADPADMGVTVGKKTGKVTVKKTVNTGYTFLVRAVINGDENLCAAKKVTVRPPATKVTIEERKDHILYRDVYDPQIRNGSLSSVRLFTVKTPDGILPENEVHLNVDAYSDEKDYYPDINSRTSKKSVAYAEWNEDERSWVVRSGGKAGTAKITFEADDGSGRKAELTVKVIVPMSSLDLAAKNRQEFVGFGRSAQFTAIPGMTFGKPSITKMDWGVRVFANYVKDNEVSGNSVSNDTVSSDSADGDGISGRSYDSRMSDNPPVTYRDDGSIALDVTDRYRSYITLSKAGRLTVKKQAQNVDQNSLSGNLVPEGFNLVNMEARVTACSTDGTLWNASKIITLSNPAKNVIWYDSLSSNGVDKDGKWRYSDRNEVISYRYMDGKTSVNSLDVYVLNLGMDFNSVSGIDARSSDPRVATLAEGEAEDDLSGVYNKGRDEYEVESSIRYPIYIYGRGTTKLTFRSKDGSNMTRTITLKVV